MSVLTRDVILKEIKRGRIKITPFDPKSVGPASVDLTLGHFFRTFKKSKKVLNITDKSNYQDFTNFKKAKSIVIGPHETILGVTSEKITLPPNICGWLEGRSRFARLGLLVHISAPFMQPGIDNHPVLEISNTTSNRMRLNSGTKVCQFIFQRTVGKAKYEGKFANQNKP